MRKFTETASQKHTHELTVEQRSIYRAILTDYILIGAYMGLSLGAL